MAPRFELKDAGIRGAMAFAVVDNEHRCQGNVVGWIHATGQGWAPYGMGEAPVFRTWTEAVDELLEMVSEEYDTCELPGIPIAA